MRRTGSCAGGGRLSGSRRAVRRRVPRTLCRKASAQARLLAYERQAASPGAGRADRRGFQKNFPRALRSSEACRRRRGRNLVCGRGRIGQKNGLVGSGPGADTATAAADQRYDNAYLSAPARREGSGGPAPSDADMMQLHLDESHATSPRAPTPLPRRAGWHTTGKLDVPDNITPIFLPSRAPELNRSRRRQYLRQNGLKHRVRKHDATSTPHAPLAKARRGARNDHVHRNARLGSRRSAAMTGITSALINARSDRARCGVSFRLTGAFAIGEGRSTAGTERLRRCCRAPADIVS